MSALGVSWRAALNSEERFAVAALALEEGGHHLLLRGVQPLQAVAIGRRILDFHIDRYGPRHWATEGARSDYAVALLAAGQRAQAVAELTEVVEVFSKQLGELPKATSDARARLAQALSP